MRVESRLYTLLYQVDRQRHITVNSEICANCKEQWCTFVCPAECFSMVEGKVEFAYDGCLECGSCRQVCEKKAIDWKYPRGGYGVGFRYG